jgi:hypothetical protein
LAIKQKIFWASLDYLKEDLQEVMADRTDEDALEKVTNWWA